MKNKRQLAIKAVTLNEETKDEPKRKVKVKKPQDSKAVLLKLLGAYSNWGDGTIVGRKAEQEQIIDFVNSNI